ncbi:MFS transporter [Lentzea sp. NPDC051208]|uniref:MFS transporter n=1 Tax=Lentzea sp. NPDC051208 TaxID=3154642 RepID=UPI0034233EA9
MAFTPAEPPPTTDPRVDPVAPHVGNRGHGDEPPKAPAAYVWMIVAATFGVYMAFVTPIAYSLAVKVSQLAPDNEEYLGYVTGAGGVAAVLAAPFFGRLSDRTRSRLGRRRPYFIAGTVIGVLALVILASAPNMIVLGVGWVLAQASWGTIVSLLLASQADRLPVSQRGKVAGLSGIVQQMAPVTGVLLSGALIGNNLLLFLVPGALGVVAMTLFVLLVHEPDSRGLDLPSEPLTLSAIVRTYTFSPRRNPDFAWNWSGKFLFVIGLTFNTTFTTFFLADRMDVTVEEVAGLVAVLGGAGVVAGMLGAIGGGFLSDRLRRRKVFVLAGAIVFSAGVVLMAMTHSMPLIITGAVLGTFGIGMFSAVDQALALDVLPERETDAGRYTGIYGFSTSIPQAIAPLIAPLFLAVGASGGDKNYTLLYLVAAAFTLAGGLVVVLRVKSVR